MSEQTAQLIGANQARVSVYLFSYRCSNCGYSGSKSQEFGKERPEKTTCLLCGCKATTTIFVDQSVRWWGM